MEYKNAAEILPKDLLEELQIYIEGELLYVPKTSPKKEWGARTGSKEYYVKRNQEIKERFAAGVSTEELAKEYGLAHNTIHKIIYG